MFQQNELLSQSTRFPWLSCCWEFDNEDQTETQQKDKRWLIQQRDNKAATVWSDVFCLRLPVLHVQWDDTSILERTTAPGEPKRFSTVREMKPQRQNADTAFMLIMATSSTIWIYNFKTQIIHYYQIWGPFQNKGALGKIKCFLDVIQLINRH